MTESNETNGSNFSDMFNPEQLRLGQNFAASIGVKKLILAVSVRKPDRQWFIRVRPEKEYRLDTAVIELKDERETYLVNRDLWSELPGEIVPIVFFTAINRQGTVFLWPVRLPDQDGKSNTWNETALLAAKKAEEKWVRVSANMNAGMYDVFEATGVLPEPEWPEDDFPTLLEKAFKDHVITALDHPVVRRLRGEL